MDCDPQDLLKPLLVYGGDDDDDRSKLVPAATLANNTGRQDTLLHRHETHHGHADKVSLNSRSSRDDLFSMNDAYSEDPPPSAQEEIAAHFFEARPMQESVTANASSHTQPRPQVTTLSLEEFDKLYEVRERASFSAVPVPIALPVTPTNSDAVPKFNHICQTRSITHLFTFEETSKGNFSSKVEFGGHVCEAEGPFPSKKLAKEAVAQRAIDVLESMETLPRQVEQRKNSKSKSKRKSSTYQDGDDDENWVALLHDFIQKNHHEQPAYRFFQADMRAQQQKGLSITPSQYSCVLRLQARPFYDFGSEDSFFQTKVEAKRVAARSAVTWLRTMGMLSEADDVKRRKSTDEGHTGLTQEASKMTTDQSAAQLVVDYSLRLGISQPQFDIRPCQNPSSGELAGQNFYVCAARYFDRDVALVPQLQGPLCQTPPVYGQKNVKKMCCEALVVLLGRVLSERMEQ